MMQQVLTPSVEHGKEANLGTEVLGVTPHFVGADFLKYLAIRFSDLHAAGYLLTRGMHLPVG
jgi:hypothetical protein